MKTDTIIELIRMLSSQGASGNLLINTGTTDGAVSFDKGQIVDAHLGKLTGFQAINALASLPDATYSYDQETPPPAQSLISSSERMLLRDFYGIQPGEPAPRQDFPLESWPEDEASPERVIPLSSLAEDPKVESRYADEQLDEAIAPTAPAYDQEATVFKHKTLDAGAPPLLTTPRVSRSFFVPALVAILFAVLIGVAAVILARRYRAHDSTAVVGPTPTVAAPVQTASPAPGPKAVETTTSDVAKSEVPNLAGNWKVINTVQQTSYQAYQNMEVGFNLSINQAGKDFIGKGQKISENGQSLPAHGRTAIEVRGTIDGDRVEATFVENGAFRKTNGRFVWRIDKRGGLKGTFNSTAARTRGRSAATKVS